MALYCDKCERKIPNEEVMTESIGGSGIGAEGTFSGNYSHAVGDLIPNIPPEAHILHDSYNRTVTNRKTGEFRDKKTVYFHIPSKEDLGNN